MENIELNGHLFTSNHNSIRVYNIQKKTNKVIPLTNTLVKIKNVHFYWNTIDSVLIEINARYLFIYDFTMSELDFTKKIYHSTDNILFVMNIHYNNYLNENMDSDIVVISQKHITNFKYNCKYECTVLYHLNTKQNIEKFTKLVYAKNSFYIVPSKLFFAIYIHWLTLQNNVFFLSDFSSKIKVERLYLNLNKFKKFLSNVVDTIYTQRKTRQLNITLFQKDTIYFLDNNRNVTVYNLATRFLKYMNKDERNDLFFPCTTPYFTFFIFGKHVDYEWKFEFYKENDFLNGFLLYFQHEYSNIIQTVQKVIKIFFSNGGFYILYENNFGEIFYDLLFYEIPKIYATLSALNIYSSNIQSQYTKLRNNLCDFLPSEKTTSQECMEISKCCICFENNSNIFFFPCNHLKCCHDCAKQMTKNECPLCRTNIICKRIVYF